MSDLQTFVRTFLLQEFVRNSSVEVRCSIVPIINLDPDDYHTALQTLVPQAIRIAHEHSDAYIRHRIEIQLKAHIPFQALPSRTKTSK